MRHLELTEGAPSRTVELSTEEVDAIAKLELAVATRTGMTGVWEVAPTSKIGVARIGDLQVTVRPKIGIDRLIFLMGYAAVAVVLARRQRAPRPREGAVLRSR